MMDFPADPFSRSVAPRSMLDGTCRRPDTMEPQLQERIRGWLARGADATAAPRGEGFAFGSVTGPVRASNQDRVLLARFVAQGATCLVAGVFDGMGGMRDGAQCAEIAASTFIARLFRAASSIPIAVAMGSALEAANQAVHSAYRGEGGAAGVAVALVNETLVGINVGDCRAYLVDRDRGVVQLSFDDTLAAHVAALSNRTDIADTRTQLLQFVGIGRGIEPHVFRTPIVPSTRGVVLSSDGAHGRDEKAFAAAVTSATLVREIVDRVLSLAQTSTDNASVVAITAQVARRANPDLLELWGPEGKLEVLVVREVREVQVPVRSDSLPSQGQPRNDKKRRRRGRRGRVGEGELSPLPERPIVERPKVVISVGPGEQREDAGPVPSHSPNGTLGAPSAVPSTKSGPEEPQQQLPLLDSPEKLKPPSE